MKILTSAVIANVRVRTHTLLHEAQRIARAVIVFLALHYVEALRERIRIGDSVGWADACVGPWGVGAQGSYSTSARPTTLVQV